MKKVKYECNICGMKLLRTHSSVQMHYAEKHGICLSEGEVHQLLAPPFEKGTPYAEEHSGTWHTQAGAPGLGKRS